MKPPSRITPLAALFGVMVWLSCAASASTVFWGSVFNDALFDSNGQPLTADYSFEIGSFGGFIPTYQNVDQWAANWKVFDRAFDATPLDLLDPDSEGWNSVEQFFAGTVEHNAGGGSDSPDANPTDVFMQGERAYLWVYNSKSIVPGSEWALLTDSSTAGNSGNAWVFPDPADLPGTSYDWQLGDADEAIIGGVNGVQGDGDYTVDPGAFSLQTHVVPEPGSALLLFAAAAAHLTRRASRRLIRQTMH